MWLSLLGAQPVMAVCLGLALAQSCSGDLEITVGGPNMWGPTLPWTRSQPVRSAYGSRGASGAS